MGVRTASLASLARPAARRNVFVLVANSLQQQHTQHTTKRRYPSSLDLIGNTPLVDITSICKPRNPNTVILGKVEIFNPGYSMKDRIVANIFSFAEENENLREGMTVVSASSGNTGCSVAMMCAMKNYKAVIITNQKCSEEKVRGSLPSERGVRSPRRGNHPSLRTPRRGHHMDLRTFVGAFRRCVDFWCPCKTP